MDHDSVCFVDFESAITDVKETVTKDEASGSNNNASSSDELPKKSTPQEEFNFQNSPFDFSAMSGFLNVCILSSLLS
jgi:hypothetical protein